MSLSVSKLYSIKLVFNNLVKTNLYRAMNKEAYILHSCVDVI